MLHPNSTMSHVNELIGPNHASNIDLIRSNLTPQSAIAALQDPISWTSPNDTFSWHHSKDGIYSVKSGYNCYWNPSLSTPTGPSSSYSIPPKM